MRSPSDEDVARFKETAQLIGNRWFLLVTYTCLNGNTRFEEIIRSLGIARNILANRLARLVDVGLLERRPVFRGARRFEYVPTREAEALRPVFQSLVRTGDSCPDRLEDPDGRRRR